MEYISREEILAEYDRQHKGPAGGARKIMETWPAADVAPVRCGKWVWHGDEEELYYACTCCGHKAYGNMLEIMDGTYRFCPYCGAKME